MMLESRLQAGGCFRGASYWRRDEHSHHRGGGVLFGRSLHGLPSTASPGFVIVGMERG